MEFKQKSDTVFSKSNMITYQKLAMHEDEYRNWWNGHKRPNMTFRIGHKRRNKNEDPRKGIDPSSRYGHLEQSLIGKNDQMTQRESHLMERQ